MLGNNRSKTIEMFFESKTTAEIINGIETYLHWPNWLTISRTENSLMPSWEPLAITTKSAVRAHYPQQIIKIGRKPPVPSRPWIHRRQVTELQQIQSRWSQHMLQQCILYRQSNPDIVAVVLNHHLSPEKNNRPPGPAKPILGEYL